MSSEFRIVPRTQIGLPSRVLSSTGNPRPELHRERWMTLHYTGVWAKYGDVGDTASEILAIQNWAVSQNKPWEYNYVIDQDDGPEIYEYSGVYQAAHSAGENDEAVGVLLLNGMAERLTDIQVRKVQWLRDVLIWGQVLRQYPDMRPHKAMPGAATICPGDLILMRWPELLSQYQPPTEPQQPNLVHLSYGLHYVQRHDTLWKLSAQYYGTGTKWAQIAEANRPDTVMNPSERWKVPGIGGVDIVVQAGWGPWTIIRAAGQTASQEAVAKFYMWNGGEGRTIHKGERVFVPYD